jgi:hypothetical protein
LEARAVDRWSWPRNNDLEEQRKHGQTVNSENLISKIKRSSHQKQPKEELMRIREISRTDNDWTNQMTKHRSIENITKTTERMKDWRTTNSNFQSKRTQPKSSEIGSLGINKIETKDSKICKMRNMTMSTQATEFHKNNTQKKHGKKYSRRL